MEANNSIPNLQDIYRLITAENIQYIYLEFQDISGISRSKLTPIRNLAKYVVEGAEFPFHLYVKRARGPSVKTSPLVQSQGTVNARLYPYLKSFIVLPNVPHTARILINPRLCEDYDPTHFSPFALAEFQLKRLENLDLSLMSALEYEFYLVDFKTKKSVSDLKWSSSGFVVNQFHGLLTEIEKSLMKIGIDVDMIHTENQPSQFEVTYKPSFGINSAIDAVTFKNTIKEICRQKGFLATFMTMPWGDKSVSSGHFNHSLWDKEGMTSLMHDPLNPEELSVIGSQWLAGLLTHLPALKTLCSTTPNCFLRLADSLVTPSRVSWSHESRVSALRVKSQHKQVRYIESRVSSSASNPFIVLAAIIAAGIDGVKRELKLTPPIPSYDLSHNADSKNKFQLLPSTMEEGLVALKSDNILIEALGKEFVDNFVSLKETEDTLHKEAIKNGEDSFDWARKSYLEYF